MSTRSRSKAGRSFSVGSQGGEESSGRRLRSRALVISSDEEDGGGSTATQERPTPMPRSRTRSGKVDGFRTPGTPPSSSKADRLRRERDRSSQSQRQPNRRGRRSSESQQEEEEDYDPFDFTGEGRRISQEEMVKLGVQHALVMQGSFHPIRKSDLIKFAMNKQSSDFREVIDEVADELYNVFGYRLVGMKSLGTGNVQCGVMEATAFILISKFRQHAVTQVAIGSGAFTGKKGLQKELINAVVMLILSCTYMLDRTIDEEAIWEILEGMEMAYHFSKKKEDLRRVLKSEFVDTLYLSKYEDKTTDQVNMRYGWGFRAEQTVNKYAMLKYVSEKILGNSPFQFPIQFDKIPLRERQKVDAYDSMLNGSALEEVSVIIKEDKDGEESSSEVEEPKRRRRVKPSE